MSSTSETGATGAQIEAAAIARWEKQSKEPDMYGRERDVFPWEELTDLAKRVHVRGMRDAAKYLVPPGYRIVGPDAVVLDAEHAAAILEIVERAEATKSAAALYWSRKDREHAARCETDAARYRALVEYLGWAGA